MSLISETYKVKILKTKRGNAHGVFSNAKPIYVVSLIDAIEEGFIIGNKILFDNKDIVSLYKRNTSNPEQRGDVLMRSNINITPYSMPFFHLNAESYYHIKWKEGVIPPQQAKSPSAKFLRENVDYAYLDDGLWELLQDPQIREDFRKAIISHYLTSDK